MDEDKIQARRREQDEEATRRRASILGLQYLDGREFEDTLPLLKGVLTIEEMYKGRLVPLAFNEEDQSYRFGVTSQTSESLMKKMQSQYVENGKRIFFS